VKRKIYLVTGASGFLGRSLVDRLRSDGHIVRRAVKRNALEAYDVECPLGAPTHVWRKALDGVDGVFHFAWSTVPGTANKAPLDDIATNVLGTVGLLEALRHYPDVRLVFASSGGAVYGAPETTPVAESHPLRPMGVYGTSKISAEGYVLLYRRQFGVDTRILRISNPYGPGQNVQGQLGAASIFAWRALAGQEIRIWGDGSIIRDYVYINDLVDAFVTAINVESNTFGQLDPILNIGSGRGTSLKQIIETIGDILKHPVSVKYEPSRSFDVPVSVLEVERARDILGWSATTSFRDGMRKMLDHFAKNLAEQLQLT
jgi:UDP-glucose 4-epimerase